MASTLSRVLLHVVFSTKERCALIAEELETDLYSYIGGIVRRLGCCLLEIGGAPDHVHLFLVLSPSVSISELVRKIKANSSKWVNEGDRLGTGFRWQNGYGVFSVSESAARAVTDYIRSQEVHHRTMSFRDELVMLMREHGIEFNERYLLG